MLTPVDRIVAVRADPHALIQMVPFKDRPTSGARRTGAEKGDSAVGQAADEAIEEYVGDALNADRPGYGLEGTITSPLLSVRLAVFFYCVGLCMHESVSRLWLALPSAVSGLLLTHT